MLSRTQQLMKISMRNPCKLQLMVREATSSPRVQFISAGSMICRIVVKDQEIAKPTVPP